MNISKLSAKQVLAGFLVALLIGGLILVVIQVRNRQLSKGSAQSLSAYPSATTSCQSTGYVGINVQFNNQSGSLILNVSASDTQSGKSVQLGNVAAGSTATQTISTSMQSISAGTVIFTYYFQQNPSVPETVTATYTAQSSCTSSNPVCTNTSQSICSWDNLPGATQYQVTVSDTTQGTTVTSKTVTAPTNDIVYPSTAGDTYTCMVSAINACGTGSQTTSKPVTCIAPTPTPTPAVCVPNQDDCTWSPLSGVSQYSVSVTNSSTGQVVQSGIVQSPNTIYTFPEIPGVPYVCSVSAVNVCGTGNSSQSSPVACTPSVTPTPSPTPTPTPTPTPVISSPPTPTLTPQPTPLPGTPYPTETPYPTLTPYPTYTPAPTVIPGVTINQLPPQVINQPGQVTYQQGSPQTVNVPGQIVYNTAPNTQLPLATPTLRPTGNTSASFFAAGVTLALLSIGGLLFFIV